MESRYIIHRGLPRYLKLLSAKYGVSMSISDFTVIQYLNTPNFKPDKFFFGNLRAKGPELRVVITNLRWPTV